MQRSSSIVLCGCVCGCVCGCGGLCCMRRCGSHTCTHEHSSTLKHQQPPRPICTPCQPPCPICSPCQPPPPPSLSLPLPSSPSLSLPLPPSPSLFLPLPPSPSLSLPLPACYRSGPTKALAAQLYPVDSSDEVRSSASLQPRSEVARQYHWVIVVSCPLLSYVLAASE